MSTSELVLEETPYLNLTTRGRKTGLKHDVELWFAFEDGKLFFLAHESSHWWKNVVKTPRVEVEVSEILFEGTGRLVPQKLEHTFELRSEEHTSELQSRFDLVCRLLLEKKKKNTKKKNTINIKTTYFQNNKSDVEMLCE